MRRPVLVLLAIAIAIACRADGASAPDGEGALVVTPEALSCTAGEVVPLAASLAGGGATPIEFEAFGGGVWLSEVRRDRGTATVRCEAVGLNAVRVAAGGDAARPTPVLVPVTVRPPAPGTMGLAVSPAALDIVNGSTAWLTAAVTSARPGVSLAARFELDDTTVVVVDSLTGTVRATGAGTTVVTVRTHADPETFVQVPVTVTRGSLVVVGMSLDPFTVALTVGDSTRLRASIIFAAGVPATTSRAVTFRSRNPNVARVSAAGVVRALAAGFTTIEATPVASPGLRALMSVSVREPPP